MKQEILDQVKKLYTQTFHHLPEDTFILPPSGSNRQYFRLTNNKRSVIGTYNPDIRENEAFFHLTKVFKELHINTPEIIAISDNQEYYLQTDFGDTHLFNIVQNEAPDVIEKYYYKSIDELIKIQTSPVHTINFSKCYPRECFDRQSIQWDLNYFKHYFLKLADISFDEQLLENDFQWIIEQIIAVEPSVFMFRDFKSKNILISNQKTFFIDYQGGRLGYPQYDLASLLFEAITDLDFDFRNKMLDYFTDNYPEKYRITSKGEFKSRYYLLVLIRLLQAMGAYGYRGFFEQKTLFLKSIPFALKNFRWLMDNNHFPAELNHLKECLVKIENSKKIQSIIPVNYNLLTINIQSFSYRKGYPHDNAGNGGGYVFDCRGLPNPGIHQEYKTLTGKDQKVIDFFNERPVVGSYINDIKNVINHSIQSYIENKYTSLQLNFGCTGGQHRSVYCAEKIAEYVKQKYNLKVILTHREQD